jgi:hypothetical protein
MVISETDRLKLQLLNTALGQAETNVQVSKLKAENAQLHAMIAKQDLDNARKSVTSYMSDLQGRYDLTEQDTVDWVTGEIIRGSNDESQEGEEPQEG